MAEASGSQSSKIVAAITTLLLIASVIYITGLLGRNARLSDDVKSRKLDKEIMLSEKLLLEKELAKLHTEQLTLHDSVGYLNHRLGEAAGNLQAKETQIRSLQTAHKPLDDMRRRQKELAEVKHMLEQKLAYYKMTLDNIQNENEDALRTITLLRGQNRSLIAELSAAHMLSVNSVLVQVLNRRDGLTIRSRNAKRLSVVADIASTIDSPVFKITGPQGNVLSADDGTLATRVVSGSTPSLFASTRKNGDVLSLLPESKRVEMVFSPAQRFESGIYTIDVLNDGLVIGSMLAILK